MDETYSIGFWGRVGIIGLATLVFISAVVVVSCFLGPGCWIHEFFTVEEDENKRRSRRLNERDRLFMDGPPPIGRKYSKPLSKIQQPDITLSTTSSSTPIHVKAYDPLSPSHAFTEPSTDSKTLLGSISAKRDSTYSSMSETSGRTSPCTSSSIDGSSISGSLAGSPVSCGDSSGQILFTVQFVLTNKERATGKLMITIQEAKSLQGRQYMGGACDPYVKITIWKERRSLRKVKSPPLYSFRTRTVRHTTNPSFNQTFVAEVNRNELKDLVMKIVTMDSDKWVSPTSLGEVIVPLKDIKELTATNDKTPLSFFLAPSKVNLGEILFGVSYLPTAQRLSVSIIRATQLKHEQVVDDLSEFYPFVRVLLISQSGRVLRKKKTTYRPNTDKPVWNETLIFDLIHHQIENLTFILSVCTRIQPPNSHIMEAENGEVNGEMNGVANGVSSKPEHATGKASPSQEKKQDKYLGKVVLGCQVTGTEERRHWMSILSSPRKVIAQWQIIK